MSVQLPTSRTVSAEASFKQQLAAARAGCTDTLGQLLEGCRHFLLMAANRGVGSTLRPKEGASDLVQDTFVLAHRDFQVFEGNSLGELLGWLNRILERQLLAQARYYRDAEKRAVHREAPQDAAAQPDVFRLADPQATPDEQAARAEEQHQVRLAIERLPADYQQALHLRNWQRLTFAEIGARLGRSPGAAEKLWTRAVERLQSELKKGPHG